jgi:hypothetical protein
VVVVVVLLVDETAYVPVVVDDTLVETPEIVLQTAVETVTVVFDIVNLIVATFVLMLLPKSIHWQYHIDGSLVQRYQVEKEYILIWLLDYLQMEFVVVMVVVVVVDWMETKHSVVMQYCKLN